ncbi:gasdermin-E isoform X2 [Rhinatrema bivittatum]|nr:gasdermin-E isoform X2 [Rhinatrema bivittatum]
MESDFVKYQTQLGDLLEANFGTEVGTLKLNAGGKGFVKSQFSFGTLRKQEADMQQLMKDVQERMINLNHPLLQQMLTNRHETLCILKEKIITTQNCVLLEHTQTEEKLEGAIGLKSKVIKVSVSENGNMIKDANVLLEIPPPTTIAYGVIELNIKRDGHFEFCLLSEKGGGFERDSTEGFQLDPGIGNISSLYSWDVVDSGDRSMMNRNVVPSDAPLSLLKQDVLQQTKIFQSFLELPEEKRSVLNKLLCEILSHGETLTLLEDVLDDICTEHKPNLTALNELKVEQQQNIKDLWPLLGLGLENELLLQPEKLQEKELLLATHVLVSALEEMGDSPLAILRACCELHLMPVLCHLLNSLSDDGTSMRDSLLSIFNDKGRFQIAQKLFSLSNISLELTEDNIRAVTKSEPGFLPLILSIILSGFHVLAGTF